MRRLLAVARKETSFILREPIFLVCQIFFPPILLALFGMVFSARVRQVPIAVFDRDGSAASRQLARELTATDYFVAIESDAPEEALASGAALASLEIAPGFATRVQRGHGPELQLLLDGTDVASVRAARGYLDGLEQVMAARATTARPPPPQLDLSAVTWFNPELSDATFFLPGVLALILSAVSAILSSLSLIREKADGTWDLLRCTPLSDASLLAGKLLPHFAQALILSGLMLLVAFFGFHLPFRGALWLLVAGTVLYVVTGIALGAIISAISENEDGAWRWLCLGILIPGIVLSGFIYPISSMPRVAEIASLAFPVRHYLEFLRAVLIKGSTFAELAPKLSILAGFCFGSLLVAGMLMGRARRAR